MSTLLVVAAGLAFGLVGYLFIALLFPEKLQ